MKKIIGMLVTLIFVSAAAAEIVVAVDQNRFFDEKGNTRVEFVYQVPYKQLSFQRNELGFEATLNVIFSLEKDGEEVYKLPFSNKIVVKEFDKTNSAFKFKDKISLTLSKSGFVSKLSFEDPNKAEFSYWESEFFVLSENRMISDLEFCEKVVNDTTLYMANLHRNGYLFDASADHVIDKKSGKFVLYYEVQNFGLDNDENCNLVESISIRKGEQEIFSDLNVINQKAKTLLRLKNVDIANFEEGYYSLILKIDDKIGEQSYEVEDYFVVKGDQSNKIRLFADLNDEFELIKYFITSKQSVWNNLDQIGKNNFISRFWRSNDPTPGTEKNEFFEFVKKRVETANQRYRSFSDGWKTDMGRIYIKYGQPDEIIKENTGMLTKYAQKEYQIWKYRSQEQLTYILVDFQDNKNFKIIYSDNDESEITMSGWEDYLGTDFDSSVLE